MSPDTFVTLRMPLLKARARYVMLNNTIQSGFRMKFTDDDDSASTGRFLAKSTPLAMTASPVLELKKQPIGLLKALTRKDRGEAAVTVQEDLPETLTLGSDTGSDTGELRRAWEGE
jgi:capsid protein